MLLGFAYWLSCFANCYILLMMTIRNRIVTRYSCFIYSLFWEDENIRTLRCMHAPGIIPSIAFSRAPSRNFSLHLPLRYYLNLFSHNLFQSPSLCYPSTQSQFPHHLRGKHIPNLGNQKIPHLLTSPWICLLCLICL